MKMKKMIAAFAVAALGSLALPTTAAADYIPYAGVGDENDATYSFTAAATGDIVAYFYGQSAGYGSIIELWADGVFKGSGLQNHDTAPGTALVLGSVTAGQTLEFRLGVSFDPAGPPPLAYTLSSNPLNNPGGSQHIYSSAYTADFAIPDGTYIGFEDIQPITGSDYDYNDHQFVFTNVGVVTTPDGGATLALLGGALMALGAARRRFTN